MSRLDDGEATETDDGIDEQDDGFLATTFRVVVSE